MVEHLISEETRTPLCNELCQGTAFIGWKTAFDFRVVRLNQSNQILPWNHLILLDKKQLIAGLLTHTGGLSIGEGHLLRRDNRVVGSGQGFGQEVGASHPVFGSSKKMLDSL